MSRLRIFNDTAPDAPLLDSRDGEVIAAELQKIGVTFERWQANQPITAGASQDEVFAAYREDIDRLVAAHGFKSVDVASVPSDHPDRAAIRQKFLDEHYHKEDEVRFFVAGSGLFTLHVADKIYQVECVKNDLISVPDGLTHWFDMGADPDFVAIRFFTEADGWVGHFTGTDLARRFPGHEPAQPAKEA
ncbi:MAG: 1,2-dihydroxy-3-keto-5-methylthiopentene dioxygenase [Stenotrophomonas sp.]